MKKSEINAIAHALARKALETRLPTDDMIDVELGKQRADDAFRRIRNATSRSKICRLLESEK